MHAVRLARAATGRDKIIKIEGGYHGLHDSVLVSLKPKAEEVGDPNFPTSVPGGAGIPKGTLQNTVVAQFNDLPGSRAPLCKIPRRNRGGHRGTHHDERWHTDAG